MTLPTLETVLAGLAIGAWLPALALALVAALRGMSAARRHAILVAALGAALVLPVSYGLVPGRFGGVGDRYRATDAVPAPEAVVSSVVDAIAPRSPGSAVASGSGTRSRGASWAMKAFAPTGLFASWLLGLFVVVARTAVGNARVRRLIRQAREAGAGWPEAARFAIGRLRASSKDVGHLRILEADDVAAPFAAGIGRQVVVVPPGYQMGMSAEERALVLLHELGHVLRRDSLWQWLARAACAVYWFQPLTWLAARRLRLESERATDDLVLTAGVPASRYAELLLHWHDGKAEAFPVQVMAVLGSRTQLELRLRHMLVADRPREPVRLRTALATAAGFGCLTALLSCASWNKPERDNEPSTIPGRSAAEPPWVAAVRAFDRSHGNTPSAHEEITSTINPVVQEIAEREVGVTDQTLAPKTIALVALEPATGEIVAMTGREQRQPRWSVAAERLFPSASAAKPLVFAAALAQGRLPLDRKYPCDGPWQGPGWKVADVNRHGLLDAARILEVSSNIGVLHVAQGLDRAAAARSIRDMGLGDRLPVELVGASAAALPDLERSPLYALLGTDWQVTPLHMAAAYAAFANGGELILPTLVRRGQGREPLRRRVLSPEQARTMLDLLGKTVSGERSTAKRARVDGLPVAGKTGTFFQNAIAIGWFVGLVPADAPRLAIAAVVEMDGGRDRMGGSTAAPLFARFVAGVFNSGAYP